ncbi:hypothetical protein [Parasulfitobacter algicola]|uniref:CDI immunity protein domain-containing protein n=1 Tax=Parasulfitobacter algicola TaxID=2614809 RepID=A0ABX2IX18_9RHOB|nr:hypothetical protein [Sulfitobacter algicola]NSX55552.1 hypothetical protein [Sulfitobacter algicola]
MTFRRDAEFEAYAKKTYPLISSDIFNTFRDKYCYYLNMDGAEKGIGVGHNGVELSIGIIISDDYANYDHPIEAYGFVRFGYEWEDDMEERMSYPDFVLFLKDAYRVFVLRYPEEQQKAKAALDKAVATIEKMQAAHLKWKKANPGMTT